MITWEQYNNHKKCYSELKMNRIKKKSCTTKGGLKYEEKIVTLMLTVSMVDTMLVG
ncbi:MAG: hypothetical protein ACI4R7_08850 [Oliverpabstia sp.]